MAARLLLQLSTLMLGLLAGAMLFILMILVPYWSSLEPATFRAWFATNYNRLFNLFVPLGFGATLIAIGAAASGWRRQMRKLRWLILAAASAVATVLITLAVNEPANLRFIAPGGLSDSETTVLLQHWIFWHSIRVALGIAAFFASIVALKDPA
jgi:hypothetical protein